MSYSIKPHDKIIEKLAMESRMRIHELTGDDWDCYQKGYLLALADVQGYLSGGVSKRIRVMLSPPPTPPDPTKED